MKHAGIAGIAVALAIVGAAPQVARADKTTVKKIQSNNRQSMENFDLLDFEAAKTGLSASLTIAKRKRLKDHPVVAETHLLLGIVEISGFNDEESALLQFMDAVAIDPRIKIPEVYQTAAADKLLAEARDELGVRGGDSPAAADEPEPSGDARGDGGADFVAEESVDCSSIEGLQHDLVDEANAGADRTVEALVGDDLSKAKVVLYYKPEGTPDWIKVDMRRQGECKYVGVIPGDRVAGDFMHYFVEAANRKGKTVATRGSKGSPNIIEILGGNGGGQDSGGGGYDDENPLGRRGRVTENGVAGGVTVGRSRSSGMFLILAGGTGGGYISGDTEQEFQPVGCCVAAEPAHFQAEVGFVLSPKTSLSVAARISIPQGADIPGHATAAPAGLLRIRRNTSGSMHLTASLGGGYIRHAVPLVEKTDEGATTDTTASGPVLVGAGFGFSSHLFGPFTGIAEVNALAGIPVSAVNLGVEDPSMTVQVDFNLGLMLDI